MKTALLISGHARFCEEFDMQIYNLENSEIDWFVTFWNRKSGDNSERHHLMPPCWQATTAEEARDIIEPKLPPGHKLVHVELLDPDEFPPLTKQYKRIDCTPLNLFQQYWILKKCDQRRQEMGNYDLVIRSRPDIGIDKAVDLEHAFNFLKQNPNCVITPYNHRNGGFNDMFAIGLPDTIKTYCEAIDHIEHFNLELNVQMHSEIMISTILRAHGLQWPPTDIRVSLREVGNGPDGPSFIPKFGRWE